DKSLIDESEEEQSNEDGSGIRSTSVDLEKSSVDVSTKGGRDGEEGTDTAAIAKNEKKECYGSADESVSDDMVVSDDEEEGNAS
nr:hypothetical protein [Tanacetum cinerariifolium]